MKKSWTPRGERLRKGIIILPSAFTLGNLFFGLYSMVSVARGDLISAGWFIIYAGILDTLDGKIARATRTGTRFGAELDSLVDAISFGVAPSFIMFELFFADAQWSWTLSFVFVTATVIRLARFNLEEGGQAKKYFHGLPAPAAGMTLAAYYPFSQTPIFAEHLSAYPWEQIAPVGTVILSILMVSSVPYDKLPKIGFSTPRGIVNSIFVSTCLLTAVLQPRYYFFTALLFYIIWGLLRSILSGRLEGTPAGDILLDEDEDEVNGYGEIRVVDYRHLGPHGPTDPQLSNADSAREDLV